MSVALQETPPALPTRRSLRFAFDPPIEGSFGGIAVLIYNIGEEGVQLEHRERLPRGTDEVLRFCLPISPQVISVRGRLLWSRPSAKKSAPLTWPWRSGVRIQGLRQLTIETVGTLVELNVVKPTTGSLQQRKQALDSSIRTALAPDQPVSSLIEKVQAIRADLAARPDVRKRLAIDARPFVSSDHDDEEVLAVWQSLDRTVPIQLVGVVFDLYPG